MLGGAKQFVGKPGRQCMALNKAMECSVEPRKVACISGEFGHLGLGLSLQSGKESGPAVVLVSINSRDTAGRHGY